MVSQGARVLLVEDEMLVAMAIEDVLRDAGWDVVGPVARVDRAVALIEQDGSLDAAVMDLNLSGQSGLPIADALAARGIPFLVLTGYGAGRLPRAHENVLVLSKPFEPDALVRGVRDLLPPR